MEHSHTLILSRHNNIIKSHICQNKSDCLNHKLFLFLDRVNKNRFRHTHACHRHKPMLSASIFAGDAIDKAHYKIPLGIRNPTVFPVSHVRKQGFEAMISYIAVGHFLFLYDS